MSKEFEKEESSTDNIEEESPDKMQSFVDRRRTSFQGSRITHRTFANSMRDSLFKIRSYYDQQNRALTSNFAGKEYDGIEDEHDEHYFSKIQPLTDRNTMNMSLSRHEYMNKRGDMGFWPTLFTFIKVNIVAGFLFLPNGFKNGGWVFSIIAIFLICLFTIHCNNLINECTDTASSYSLSRIGFKALGKLGYYLVEYGVAISQICFPCSYANLITQISNNILHEWFDNKLDYSLYIAIVLALIVIPLCFIRKINKFSSFHFIGDLAVLATVIALIYESVNQIAHQKDFNFDNLKMFNSGWAVVLGTAITSLEGIGIMLPIKENMREKQKFKMVNILGIAFIGIIFMIFPLIMYICYQDSVNVIVLNNLPMNKLYIQIILGLLIFSIIIVYPVVFFPAFKLFVKLLF
jgi:amino acid permease